MQMAWLLFHNTVEHLYPNSYYPGTSLILSVFYADLPEIVGGTPIIVYTPYIILLYPDDDNRRTTTVCTNDTLVDTLFQLISGFFHVNQGI